MHSGKSGVFPAGTSVAAYRASDVEERSRAGTAPGAATAVATVTAGSDGAHAVNLSPGEYYYYAAVGGAHRYVFFRVVS